MAAGTLDTNGVWIYGEDDPASPVSDLLNLGMGSVSNALGTVKGRVTTLEAAITKTAVVFTAGWANYEAVETTYNACRWFKDKAGVVHLEGLLKRTGATITAAPSGVIITLPVGARPLRTHAFPIIQGNTTGRMEINADGTIACGQPYTWTTGSSFAYLDGISFMAA